MKLSLSLETTEAETGILCETLSAGQGGGFDAGAAISAVQSIVTAYLAHAAAETPSEPPTSAGATPPPTAAKPAEDPERRNKRIARGSKAYYGLVEEWCRGFGEVDTEQPDRANLLREVSTGPTAGDILEYVSGMGGLLRATDTVLAFLDAYTDVPEAKRREHVYLVAANITQVASLMFPDLADQYEHTNIYS